MLEGLNAIAGILTFVVFLFLEWPRLTSRLSELIGSRAKPDTGAAARPPPRMERIPAQETVPGSAHDPQAHGLAASDFLLPTGMVLLFFGWLGALDLVVSSGLLCIGIGAIHVYAERARHAYGRPSILLLLLGAANILMALVGSLAG